MFNEFFGFDGFKMGQAFGKDFRATTKTPNYSAILRRFKDLLNQCLGPDIVLVLKIANGNNHIDKVKGLNHKITLSGLTKDSYGYAMKGIRKYNFIRFQANVNGHNYEVDFQFRGTTAVDTGPRYLRILFKITLSIFYIFIVNIPPLNRRDALSLISIFSRSND